MPSYTPGPNDYYDDPCIIPELNSGSLSDTEITLRLEPHPEDISDMSADLNESFQKLRTDTNRNNGSDDVTIISKDTEKHEDMKKVIQDIESQLTPPDQNIHMNEIYMTDQYFGTDQVTFEYVDDTFKTEQEPPQQLQPVQKIEPKLFKTPMAPPMIKAPYKEEKTIRKLSKTHQKPTHLIMHQQMESGTGSKGQSKLVDEAYDEFGTVADLKSSDKPQPIDFILVAATSPSTKVSEESLTYLNQGQSYGIRMRRRQEEFQRAGLPISTPLRIQLRVIFHERRLQNIEDEQLKVWSESRPGERFLEVVTELSEHISNVSQSPNELNCSEFSWNFKKVISQSKYKNRTVL